MSKVPSSNLHQRFFLQLQRVADPGDPALFVVFLINDSTLFSSCSKTSWPMTMRPFSLYFICSWFRCGIEMRQGPHQVAQNSTRYALLFSNSFTGSPWTHLPTWSFGALSPIFSAGSLAACSTRGLAERARIVAVHFQAFDFMIRR